MKYQTAYCIAIIKRLLGWLIFLAALVSTLISLLKVLALKGIGKDVVNSMVNEMIKMLAKMLQENTSFLDFFWQNSPLPESNMGLSGENWAFILIFLLIFVGIALRASGTRMQSQLHFIKQSLEDHVLVEQAKGNTVDKTELEQKLTVPNHSIFRQIFVLYLCPIIFGVLLYWGFLELKW